MNSAPLDFLPPPLLCLMGPTGAGKTALAIALADSVGQGALGAQGILGAKLISVDSAQVYRGMDIGSAKPDLATRARWPHALHDILDPVESYSAARFVLDVLPLIAAAQAERLLPILVGGTGLYFRSLLQGMADMPSADAALRERIARDAATRGWPALHAELAALDPTSAQKIKPNDPQRITRALELISLTGKTRTTLWQQTAPPPYVGPVLKFAVPPPSREAYHQRLADRFTQMMDEGFLEEVRALHRRGDLRPDMPAIRAVGYRQLWEHLEGRHSLPAAIALGVIATRQYAKRQMTWLRSEPDLVWLTDPATALEQILQNLGRT